jgi:hypothetical protein
MIWTKQNTNTDALPARRGTWMSNSLIDGLVVVIRRIRHHGHRTSLTPDLHVWGYIKKTWCVNESRREEIHHRVLGSSRRMNDPMLYVRLKSSWISNTHSFVTVKKCINVHMTFLTGNDLRNTIWSIDIKSLDILYKNCHIKVMLYILFRSSQSHVSMS